MAAIHFITIPCDSNTANRNMEGKIRPCTNNIVYATVEVF